MGRVTFHLAENKRNPAYPFAFLATYTHRVSEQGKVQHLPLGRALEEYAGAKNRAALAALAVAGATRGGAEQAGPRIVGFPRHFSSASLAAGTGLRLFAGHSAVRAKRLGGAHSRLVEGGPAAPAAGDRCALAKPRETCSARTVCWISKWRLSLEGEPLTESELKAILQSTSGLVLLKGKWVEVDRDKLQQVLDHWKKVQAAAGPDGLPLLEGLRLLSGFQPGASGASRKREAARADWSSVIAGEGLKEAARGDAAAGGFRRVRPGRRFAGGSCVRINARARIGSGS